MSSPTSSVVIGFKDWGLDRLQQCIRSIHASFESLPVEVVVSDYGSEDGTSVRHATEGAGGVYVRTDTDGTWSRSRALNAGFAHSRGEVWLSTDADMIFTPGALRRVVERILAAPHETIILQCRDLPPSYAHPLDAQEVDWHELERIATLRPRWGMGGLVATSPETLLRVRGYEERMHTYGGEDIDFGKRVRRIGSPINWMDEPGVRMFHVWHASSSAAAQRDPAAIAAIAANRAIHETDPTFARNATGVHHLGPGVPALVSVIVDLTGDDSNSRDVAGEVTTVLAQTAASLEVLLVDRSGRAKAVIDQLGDDRVRRLDGFPDQPWWRVGIEAAEGTYVLLHTAGGYMASERLQHLVHACSAGGHAVSDGLSVVVQRDDEFLPLGQELSSTQLVPWASVLLRTTHVRALLPDVKGDPGPMSLIFAVVRNGIRIQRIEGARHVLVLADDSSSEVLVDTLTRQLHLLRRLLHGQRHLEWLDPFAGDPVAKNADLLRHHLTNAPRVLGATSHDPALLDRVVEVAERHGWVTTRASVATPEGDHVLGLVRLYGSGTGLAAAQQQMARGAAPGSGLTLDAVGSSEEDGIVDVDFLVGQLVRQYDSTYAAGMKNPNWVVVRTGDPSTAESVIDALRATPGVDTVMARDLELDGHRQRVVLALTGRAKTAVAVLLAARAASQSEDDVMLHPAPGSHDVLRRILEGNEGKA